MTLLENVLKEVIREVPDFPKPGINFKDITPLFLDPQLCRAIVEAFVNHAKRIKVDAICGVESRGFLFGPIVAQQLDIPFILIRKKGKLPGKTLSQSYQSEYGEATIEVHEQDLKPKSKILIHDDILATGGTVIAAAELVKKKKCKVVGFSFVAELGFLGGAKKIKKHSKNICSLVNYDK